MRSGPSVNFTANGEAAPEGVTQMDGSTEELAGEDDGGLSEL